ncbi:MAG: hypothetical protein ACI9D1_002499, partial [Cryomorphaceae bacterium]
MQGIKKLYMTKYVMALAVIFAVAFEGHAQTEGALSSEEAETFLKGVNFNGMGRV